MDNGLNLFDNQTYTRQDIQAELAKALYESTDLEFLIEEFVKTENSEYHIPSDYKFYVFNGEIACIHLINRLSPKTGCQGFYTENWELMSTVNDKYEDVPYQEPPSCLKEMVQHAKQFSKAYQIFVRVDFYATDKGAVFGEFSPTPHLGENFTPYGEKLLTSY